MLKPGQIRDQVDQPTKPQPAGSTESNCLIGWSSGSAGTERVLGLSAPWRTPIKVTPEALLVSRLHFILKLNLSRTELLLELVLSLVIQPLNSRNGSAAVSFAAVNAGPGSSGSGSCGFPLLCLCRAEPPAAPEAEDL